MRGKAWEEGQECGIVKVGLGTWAQRKERGWRGSGTLHEGHGSLGHSSAESTFGTLSRRPLGGARPGLPGRFPRRAPRAAKQANLCADRGAVPGRNGRASCGSHSAVLPHARRQAPAQPSPGATAGTPRASCVTRTDQPRLPILFRSVSSPALLRAPPSAAGARTHLGGLCLASRLPSTTAGTQLVSSVQSACSPQLQPVENLKKSQVSRLPSRWQVHAF